MSTEKIPLQNINLGLLLKASNGLIKNRRYHLRVYPSCFIASEAVDWVVKWVDVKDRAHAVSILQQLGDRGEIEHVTGNHSFKDDFLFFRLSSKAGTLTDVVSPRDDSSCTTFPIYQRVKNESKHLVQDRRYRLKVYPACFVGSEMVSFVLENFSSISSRVEATRLLRLLYKDKFIFHVMHEHAFDDGNLFYRFREDDLRPLTEVAPRLTLNASSLLPTTFPSTNKSSITVKYESRIDDVFSALPGAIIRKILIFIASDIKRISLVNMAWRSRFERYCCSELRHTIIQSGDCIVAINGRILDLSSFLTAHPGGPTVILAQNATNASKKFAQVKHSGAAHRMMESKQRLSSENLDQYLSVAFGKEHLSFFRKALSLSTSSKFVRLLFAKGKSSPTDPNSPI